MNSTQFRLAGDNASVGSGDPKSMTSNGFSIQIPSEAG